jgi:hypothetical protein
MVVARFATANTDALIGAASRAIGSTCSVPGCHKGWRFRHLRKCASRFPFCYLALEPGYGVKKRVVRLHST